MAKLSVSSKHSAKLSIDGTHVDVLVGRMQMAEFIEFETNYFEYGRPARGAEDADDIAGRAALLARSHELLKWVEDSVTKYASFPPGEVEIDGTPVETGAEIVRVFGARQLLMMQVINLVWASNRLPDGIKKNLKPLSDFLDGSSALSLDQAGNEPEPIATPADESTFAVIADATIASESGAETTRPYGETIE